MKNYAFDVVKRDCGEVVVIAKDEGDNSAEEGRHQNWQEELFCFSEIKDWENETHKVAKVPRQNLHKGEIATN